MDNMDWAFDLAVDEFSGFKRSNNQLPVLSIDFNLASSSVDERLNSASVNKVASEIGIDLSK